MSEIYKINEMVQYYDDLLLGEDIRDVILYDRRGNIIEDYTNLYQVTSYGRVWSLKNQIWLKAQYDRYGYQFVTICKKPEQKQEYISRLVLFAFIGGPYHWSYECRHLDGNKLNNKLSNLKWGSKQENYLDSVEHGTAVFGEDNGLSKLTNEQVFQIRDLYKTGLYSQNLLGEKFNIDQGQISRIVNEINWGHI